MAPVRPFGRCVQRGNLLSVEVPTSFVQERLTPVPHVQIAEAITQVSVPHIRQEVRHIPKIDTQTVEKVVQIPTTLVHEIGVDVGDDL